MNSYDKYLETSLEKLKTYLSEGKMRPILFIGSGFSQRYFGAPTWLKLLEYLFENVPNCDYPLEYYIEEFNGSYSKVANVLVELYRSHFWDNRDKGLYPEELSKSQLKSIYLKYNISKLFKELIKDFNIEHNELADELKLLQQLKPQTIITTNYDTLLEELFPIYNVIVGQKAIHKRKSNNSFNIFKIHGCVNHYEEIIINEKDYEYFNENQLYITAKLLTYFVESPIIFLGYSLNDDNIRRILSSVKKIMQIDDEKMMDNMWFIDWTKEKLEDGIYYNTKKGISLGNGESISMNYIVLNRYEELYKALYQDSIDIEFLQRMEETIYNIIKSDSITNLEVDIASLGYMTNPNELLERISSDSSRNQYVSLATISDPNQLATQYSLTATKLAELVYEDDDENWHSAYQLMDRIKDETGINLRDSQNKYYVNMDGVSRFSIEAVNLLKKIKENIPCTFTIDKINYNYPK